MHALVPATTDPPIIAHTAGSCTLQVLQQQHADGALLHGGAPEQTVKGVKFVPEICAHVPEETYEHTLFAGLQHAPGTSAAHTLAEQGFSPSHVPAFLMQSQLVAAMHVPFMQHLPYTGAVGQVLGVHVPPATYVEAPVHGWAAVTTKQAPVHGWQHTPVPGGHGFGVQAVAVTATDPDGQGVPSGTVEQAPVDELQQTCTGARHGVTAAHVSPSEKIPGGTHAVAPDTIAHSPLVGSQHAPCVPGGHGFGEHEVALKATLGAGQTVPLTIAHAPVVGLQHSTLGGTHGFTGAHVEPVPAHTPGVGHAALFATIAHTLAPAAFTVQHAPWVPGGQGFGEQLVAVTAIDPAGHDTPPTIWHTPEATLQHVTLGGTHGLTGVHVEPTPPHTPLHAVWPGTIVQTDCPAAFTVQHAPLVGGGHGLVGRQVCPLESIVPGHGVPSGTIVQFPAASQQAYRLAIPGHGFGLHAVIVELIVPLQLAAVYTTRQLLLISQQNRGGQGAGLHVAKFPNHPVGHPSPVKFAHAPVATLQQFVFDGGHGFGVHVVLLLSTVPLHGALGAISVQLPRLSQHTTTGQIPGVHALPTIDDPTSAQNRGFVTMHTVPQQHATVGPTHGALAQLVCPGWNTVPPLAVHSDAVVTMHPAGLQHTPNTVGLHSPTAHALPAPFHTPPCISHSHWVFCTHAPLGGRQHAPACARARGANASAEHIADTTHSIRTTPVKVFMACLLPACARSPNPQPPPRPRPKRIARGPHRPWVFPEGTKPQLSVKDNRLRRHCAPGLAPAIQEKTRPPLRGGLAIPSVTVRDK